MAAHRHSPELEQVHAITLAQARWRTEQIGRLRWLSKDTSNPTRQDSLFFRVSDATEALVDSAALSSDEVVEYVTKWLTEEE